MKEDALELLMVAYQQAGDAQKTLDAANRVLQADPNNVRALALLAYNYRAAASQGGPQMQDNLAKAQQYGQQGSAGSAEHEEAGRHERRRLHQAA